MALFKKPDDHAGSGIDKPDPKSIKEKVSDVVKAIVPAPPPAEPVPAKGPEIP